MKKLSPSTKKQVQALNKQLSTLQAALVVAKKREGRDDYITVAVRKNQARGVRTQKPKADDTYAAHFFIEITITAKKQSVYIPLSVATGKKTSGFMYYIESDAGAPAAQTTLTVTGSGTHITVGTLKYIRIDAGAIVSCKIHATLRAQKSKQYRLVFDRIYYKLDISETRYHQYGKELKTAIAKT